MTKYNLVLAQGKTLKRTWTFRSTVALSQDLVPGITTPPTSISVISLTHPVVSGTLLKFPIKGSCDTTDLITSAAAAPGDTTIPILPYTGTLRLPCKTSVAPNDLIPLNDLSLVRGNLRTAYADAAPSLTFTFSVLPSQGTIVQTASSVLTAALTPNCIFSDVPSNPQDDAAWDKNVFRRAYFWDAEIVRLSGDVDEFLEGRCWVKSEATK